MKNKGRNYKGYRILAVNYQQTRCYKVQQPNGKIFNEIAANLKTAKKWIDLERGAL